MCSQYIYGNVFKPFLLIINYTNQYCKTNPPSPPLPRLRSKNGSPQSHQKAAKHQPISLSGLRACNPGTLYKPSTSENFLFWPFLRGDCLLVQLFKTPTHQG